MILSGFIGLLVLSWPAFALIQMDNVIVRLCGLLIIGLLVLCFSATTLPALFPTAVRYSALSITFSLSTSLFGGTTPLMNEWLHRLAVDRGLSWANDIPTFYFMVGAAIGIGVMTMYRETAGQPLEGSTPWVSDPSEAGEVVAEYRDPTSDLSQSDWGVGYARSRR